MARRGCSRVAIVSAILAGCTDPHFRDPGDAEAGMVSDAARDASLDFDARLDEEAAVDDASPSEDEAAIDAKPQDQDEAAVDTGLAHDSAWPDAAEAGIDAGLGGQDEAAIDTGSPSEADAAIDAATDASQVMQSNDAEAGSDSGPTEPPDPHPDMWAGPLLGTYAARTDWFTYSGPLTGMNHIQEVSLVTIERSDSKVWLSAQTCNWGGSNVFGTTRLLQPSAVPLRRARVRYTNDRWRTEPSLQTQGYNAEAPTVCVGNAGAKVPKQPWQDWLGDTCSCPPASTEMPVLDDCRVTDPDGDRAAGIAYEVKILLPNTTTRIQTVRELRSNFQDGVISPDGRHSAREAQYERWSQLSCNPGCADIAASATPCLPSTSRVRFARLVSDGGPPTCEQALLTAASELDTDHAPPDPSLCPK